MNQALHLPAYPVTDDCIGGVAEFEHTQPWIYGLDNPYLHGVYAPTTLELSESGLRVEGELPKDLLGTYFRNGPNPIHQPENRYHPFDGDGMVHAVSFCEGEAASLSTVYQLGLLCSVVLCGRLYGRRRRQAPSHRRRGSCSGRHGPSCRVEGCCHCPHP